jgi:Lamin Tail Domain
MRAVRLLGVAVATLGIAAAAAAPVTAAQPTRSTQNVYLAQVRYQARSDRGVNGEYVKITNGHDYYVNLRHWTLSEHHGNLLYAFPDKWLAPHASMWLYSGVGVNDRHNLYWDSVTPVWRDAGDRATLRNGRGTMIDTAVWQQRGVGYLNVRH